LAVSSDGDVSADLAQIEAQGFVVVPGLLSEADIAEVRTLLAPHLRGSLMGRNDFEGHRTERVYALVGRGGVFERLVEHPRVLAVCDALLEPNYLLTASQAININPGETSQAFHTDDLFYSIPRPRKAISVSTIVAVDAFTTENGATQVIPGSHRWDDGQIARLGSEIDFTTAAREDRVPRPSQPLPQGLPGRLIDVAMAPGSAIVFLGTLVHRGGENRSPKPRLALSNQYCEPWARQQENYSLAIPPERVRELSPRVQALLGYSIHPPFMGHVGGVHPRRLLDA
jgi:ectoine hydroxylase-related dioxygenase (phytanoyl-CoA dioxygenase family)